ncbi:exo-beta-N-acetylmuramidase NamZ family protein [Rhodohalobacter sulfatireducens]|uniref:DUF1343 domain-containing protein n=1 Tax=Rhodohalobacter sulfatireducens TaxID=2911366 RepID=A0ABS9KE90_9BACT|nr:DUF1343 domain-containing protein [Rhodohalobacter sulfatireducens]MCG2589181.1 DUF1343 domain-containing protein [Rhodohalobacter sulfatireducens]
MSIQIRFLLLSLIAFSMIACSEPNETTAEEAEPMKVRTGAEMLIENHLDELDGQRVGLVMNPTARIGNTHMLDTLMALDVNVSALFAPEHGFRGEAGAGEKIEDGVDQETGLPVFSLYGDTRKPTPEMLEEVDLLIFDMQDVGARFYTYNATMGLVIEAAADVGIPVWILDRPNPAGGDYVSGWLMEDEHQSFVGAYPIPVAHGLTLGELAEMAVDENWLNTDAQPDVRVIQMDGWTRDMKWPDTGLDWVAPSPNLPTFDHAFMYLGTVYFEGTSLSEGRGTNDPFLTAGAPATYLSDGVLEDLNNLTNNVSVEATEFTPESIPGVAISPKHQDTVCYGVKITLNGYDFDPVRTGLKIFTTLVQSTSEYEIRDFIYLLAGSTEIDQLMSGELTVEEINFELGEFLESREQYLLY